MQGTAGSIPPLWRARSVGIGISLLLALALTACSTPMTGLRTGSSAGPLVVTPAMIAARENLSRMAALQDRLYRVAAPLLINNAELCPKQARGLLGFTAKNKYSYPGEFADAAQAALGYDERLQVSGVLAGSGAQHAGLRKGDALITAGGKPLPTGPNAETEAAAIFGPLVANRAALTLTVARDSASRNLNVPVTRACGFRVDLGSSDNVNSYTDDQRILITRGMINFAQTDDGIAIVLAKGMAHNILGHAAAQRSSATLGSVIDNLDGVRPDLSMLIGSAGIKPMPQELDAAADSLALYLLARAGYNIDNAARFWQRLATQYPATVLNGYTANHPGTAYRIAAINKTVAEIKGKQAAKKALLP